MNVLFKEVDQSLDIKVESKVNKLEYGVEGVQAQKKTIKQNLKLPLEKLYIYGDTFNQEYVRTEFNKIFEEIKTKTTL